MLRLQQFKSGRPWISANDNLFSLRAPVHYQECTALRITVLYAFPWSSHIILHTLSQKNMQPYLGSGWLIHFSKKTAGLRLRFFYFKKEFLDFPQRVISRPQTLTASNNTRVQLLPTAPHLDSSWATVREWTSSSFHLCQKACYEQASADYTMGWIGNCTGNGIVSTLEIRLLGCSPSYSRETSSLCPHICTTWNYENT